MSDTIVTESFVAKRASSMTIATLFLLMSVALVMVPSNLMAQPTLFDDPLGSIKRGPATPKPTFTVSLNPSSGPIATTLSAGDEVMLSVTVRLPKLYYIYGTDGDFGGRTMIDVTPVGLEETDPEWKPDREPKRMFEPLLMADVSKFYDHVTWKKRYRVTSTTEPSGIRVEGEL
ncbi:MAG: hypothetical protein FJ267_13050, partial [Planctomycetes bacterium]|nr:hypothetical protein [Planctomycetota bacterium]